MAKPIEIRLGLGSCCVASGSREVFEAVQRTVAAMGADVQLRQAGCVGICHRVPLLEVIEPGDEVMGVAIMIDPEDFDRVLLLARSCGLNETMLDGEIYDLVSDLAPLYSGHPALARFRKAPPVHRGETDEVIDLNIEELTDH